MVVDLTTDFLSRRNIPVLEEVEDLVGRLRREGAVPAGLRIPMSGSAVPGRDMMLAESRSARTIQSWTIWLVIILLLVYYPRRSSR